MEQELDQEDRITRYLLGDLPEEEQRKLEDEYFADDSIFEELSILECELIDRYVLGHLSDQEREKFEKNFLTSASRQARVANAKILFKQRHLPQPPEPAPTWFQSLLAFWRVQSSAFKVSAGVFVAILAVGGIWLLLRQSSLPLASQEISFDLVSTAIRGNSESNTLEIPKGISTVKLNLYFESGTYKTYTATLQKTSGEVILKETLLTPQFTPKGKMVLIALSANILKNGNYVITVAGGDSDPSNVVGEYYFRIVEK